MRTHFSFVLSRRRSSLGASAWPFAPPATHRRHPCVSHLTQECLQYRAPSIFLVGLRLPSIPRAARRLPPPPLCLTLARLPARSDEIDRGTCVSSRVARLKWKNSSMPLRNRLQTAPPTSFLLFAAFLFRVCANRFTILFSRWSRSALPCSLVPMVVRFSSNSTPSHPPLPRARRPRLPRRSRFETCRAAPSPRRRPATARGTRPARSCAPAASTPRCPRAPLLTALFVICRFD